MQRHFMLLIALVGWGIIQSANGSRLQVFSKSCIAGIQGQPGIQMEFAKDASQVSCLLEEARMEPGDMNRQIIREQQYLDFVFIPLYWAFFYCSIGGAFRRSSRMARLLGKWLRVSISIAALADFAEDAAIFCALDPAYHGSLWPFHFGFIKWLFFFLALGCSAGLFLRDPRLGSLFATGSQASRVAHWLIGPFFLGGALLGLVGTVGSIENKGYWLTIALWPVAAGVASLLLRLWKERRFEPSDGIATI
ncbi:MAG TPA: hypothetical protein VI636_22215 [Candidatus Angelobacter sp.]